MEKNVFRQYKISASFLPHFFERHCAASSLTACGIDEVGRGSIAGPLVAAAALLRPQARNSLLKDSKLLTPAQREEAYTWLTRHATWGIGAASVQFINSHGISAATRLAMRRAFQHLISRLRGTTPACVLVDALSLELYRSAPGVQDLQANPAEATQPIDYLAAKGVEIASLDGTIWAFPYGESYSRSIAAASIIAKVERDRLMVKLHHSFPQYQLDAHKGYGTGLHHHKLVTHGPSVLHRLQFAETVLRRECTYRVPMMPDADEHEASMHAFHAAQSDSTENCSSHHPLAVGHDQHHGESAE